MAEGSSDPPDLNPDGTPHHKQHHHSSRRTRPRHNNDRNLSGYSCEPTQQYGNFHEGFKHTFGQNNSNYPQYATAPYPEVDVSRRRGRGRGRREESRRINENVGGSGYRQQKPGRNPDLFGASNRYASSMDGPDAPSWRRENGSRDFLETQIKKPRSTNQEQRKGEENEKGDYTSIPDQRPHGSREETTKSRPQTYDQQRKSNDVKRRQGPIKPPKPPFHEDSGSKRGEQEGAEHLRASQDAACKSGKGSGPQKPFQGRGGRRTNHQSVNSGQRSSDKMPKSKETQTGCLIEQLSEEKYECMVCCDVIRVMAPVWSCHSCFHVFHLNCIKKWARSPASQADDSAEGWRCPACQNVALKHPATYICFCGERRRAVPSWKMSGV